MSADVRLSDPDVLSNAVREGVCLPPWIRNRSEEWNEVVHISQVVPSQVPAELSFPPLRIDLRTKMRHAQTEEVFQTLLRGRLRLQVALR
ncbi:hypothetical protein MRX96_025613 [Rhipicephalus microplus]